MSRLLVKFGWIAQVGAEFNSDLPAVLSCRLGALRSPLESHSTRELRMCGLRREQHKQTGNVEMIDDALSVGAAERELQRDAGDSAVWIEKS